MSLQRNIAAEYDFFNGLLAFEVTPDGEKVWEFLNSNMTDEREPSVIVRMRRYDGVDYDELVRRLASGRRLHRVD